MAQDHAPMLQKMGKCKSIALCNFTIGNINIPCALLCQGNELDLP